MKIQKRILAGGNILVTGELKNKIDGLWDIFWAGGLSNPLDVIEQMTYLMFIHDLDAADTTHIKESIMLGIPYKSIFEGDVTIGDRIVDGNQLKWSVFRDFPAEKMYSVMQELVFPFIKSLHGDKDSAYAKYMGDAIFKIPTPLMLDKIVNTLDGIYEQMAQLKDADIRGDVYEYLLSKLASAGVAGQFRTPRHIIDMIVELVEPKADDIICDPACGTAGFLVGAGEYLRKKRKEEVLFNRQNKDHYMNHMFHGFDMADPVFNDQKVSKFVNHLMYDGKKNTSYEIFYNALKTVETKLPGEETSALEVWKKALDNVTPQLEVKSRRIGGATFQVPTEIRPDRKESISMKNMIAFARKRGGKSMADKLAAEILDAYNEQGGAFKRKEDMHRMAEANRAFAHFRF